MKPEKAVGEVVRAARKRLGFTQNELAEKANIERDYVSRIERGTSSMSIRVLYRVGPALGMRPFALLALADQVTHGPADKKSPPAIPPRRL